MATADKREAKASSDERGRRANAARRARRLAKNQADAMPVVRPTVRRRSAVVDAELVEPAPRGGLLEALQQPYLLRLIVRRQLAQMYAASLLGLLWSYVQPAMRFAVYYLVMGFILQLHEDIPYFALHLFTGIVVVHYFGETWGGGTRSIWQNKALVNKMRMPREIFPVASMLVAAYHTLPQVLVLVVCCLLSGWHLTWGAVGAGALGVAILITFSLALALFFSRGQRVLPRLPEHRADHHAVHALPGADDVPVLPRLGGARRAPVALQHLRRQPGHPGGAAAAEVLLVPPDRGHQRPRRGSSRRTCGSAA